MTLPLAVQRAQGVELRVIDYRVEPLQGTIDASGSVTLTTQRSVDPDTIWRIERLTVQATSAGKLNLQVTDGTSPNGPINPGLRDFGQLPSGFPQVAEYPQPMTLLGGQQFTLIASSGAKGDIVTASVQYAIVMRVPVQQ